MEACHREMSMSDQFEMWSPETLTDTDRSTSSPGLEVSPLPAGSRAGRTADLFGPADILVSPSVTPGSAAARKMTATSGQRCIALLIGSAPLKSLGKTLLVTSVWASTRCFLTWKPAATPQGRLLFRLVPSMPRTDGIGSGLWPTPVGMDHQPQNKQEKIEAKANGQTRYGLELRDAVHSQKFMATPTATANQLSPSMAKHPGCREWWPTPHGFSKDGKSNGPSGNELGRAVNQSLWPTPRSSERAAKMTKENVENRIKQTGYRSNLEEAVALWPTPTSRDWRSGKASEATHERNAKPLNEVATLYPTPDAEAAKGRGEKSAAERGRLGGSLNADWVSWMMGYPPGWLELPEDG